jgi:protein-L-isoaspartate(D-aspartate) O-methyltransferase
MKPANFRRQRERLVDKTLRGLGICDESVLQAIRGVPREEFVSDQLRSDAYRNTALPISCGQTISQPLIVAQMLEVLDLEPGDKVLEVGTGSGYAAAVMAKLAGEVFTIERVAELALAATSRL